MLAVCLIALIAISLIPLSIVWNKDKRMNELQVRNGVMDLSAWDYEQSLRIKLDGEWGFYWDQLLTPANRHGQALSHRLHKSAFPVERQSDRRQNFAGPRFRHLPDGAEKRAIRRGFCREEDEYPFLKHGLCKRL
jgi:hypothetical protein